MSLSAIISASETAFFSLRPWRVEQLCRQKPGPGGLIREALRDPRIFVVSIIIGTELVNVASSNLVAMLRRRLAAPALPDGVTAAALVAITSGVLVLVCDIVPKSLAVASPEAVALRLARPLWAFFALIRPLAVPLARLTSFMTEGRSSRPRTGPGPAPLSEEDFRTLVEISRREGVLTDSQTEMIEAVFRLGDLQVRQVMVPRPDVVAVRDDADPEEALRLIREGRHSRVPVYRQGLDEITGVLYAKDLLARRFGLIAPRTVRELARPALFVPEVMRARQLVRELQSRKVHLAIVVDEYGGTAGVVTLEDLLEEMVGEFSDEFERPVRVFRRLRRGLFWVRASMPLPEFNRRVRSRIKDPEVDTVGGYVLKLFDRVPSEDDSVSDEQFTFTVRRMKGRRILVLLVARRGVSESAREGSPEKESPAGARSRNRRA
ncbi:MAG TPA: hemolysin family protein [Candidatus Polarisedimenticolia bacterium]|nr:hemolysin family protein [Candidatus Polarisedimenticolia bacterium]